MVIEKPNPSKLNEPAFKGKFGAPELAEASVTLRLLD